MTAKVRAGSARVRVSSLKWSRTLWFLPRVLTQWASTERRASDLTVGCGAEADAVGEFEADAGAEERGRPSTAML